MAHIRPVASSVVLFVCGLLASACSIGASGAHGYPTSSLCKPLPDTISVGTAWGGTRVPYNAQETANFFYVGYYDAERWLAVSQIDKCTAEVRTVRLPSRFAGWDAHNSVALALDQAGRLHVAGNMHASPLVYSRMDKADDLSSLTILKPMVGSDEEKTTYPMFFRFEDGSLGFSYRTGQSGNGCELINRFDGERWSRLGERPLFAPASSGPPVNAYHTGFVRGPDHFFHVAWVWRETHNVETNFNVNYAKSPDLRTWLTSTDEILPLPITPAKAEIADPVPQQSGLFNNVKLGFDVQGRPVISYVKFDSRGHSQLFHARPENGKWQVVQSTTWAHRWDPRGGGTIPAEIGFSGVEVHEGRLLERIRHPVVGAATLVYAPDSLRETKINRSSREGPTARVMREVPPGALLNVQPVFDRAGSPSKVRAISWLSHPADNRDRPRNCATAVPVCDFRSELQLHLTPSTHPAPTQGVKG